MNARRLLFLAVLTFFALSVPAVSFAQDGDGEAAAVSLRQDPGVGSFLVDGQGRSLYALASDDGDASCTGDCLESWQPFISSGRPIGRAGVVPGFLSTVEGPGGESQVAYRGAPLFYYVGDEEPGEANGQGGDDIWFLVSQTGDPVAGQPAGSAGAQSEAASTAVEVDPEAVEQGRDVYAQFCISCHGMNGEGGQGTKLAGEPRLANSHDVVQQILAGGDYMPGFGSLLDDQQVAHVATYIRNAWGNEYGPISEEEVAPIR